MKTVIVLGTVRMLPDFNHLILKSKKKCYPANTKISEQEAVVDLQETLNLTAFRLLRSLGMKECLAEEYTLLYKWGFDGSSGHTSFKQNFAKDASFEDCAILTTTIVPVLLINKCNQDVAWRNPAPNSSRYYLE